MLNRKPSFSQPEHKYLVCNSMFNEIMNAHSHSLQTNDLFIDILKTILYLHSLFQLYFFTINTTIVSPYKKRN